MPLYLSVIHWTNEAGNNSIVGLFDDIDLATQETRRHYESVRGEIRTQTAVDLVTRPDDLLHRVLAFNGEMTEDMQMHKPGSNADIYEMPVNSIFPGELASGNMLLSEA